MIYIIIALSIGVVILGYTTFNLLRKNEAQEDILASYMTYLNKISEIIDVSDTKLKEVDEKGLFEADDEIGWFFEQVKMIQKVLNQFNVKDL